MGVKHNVSYRSGENMAKKTDEELYDVAINIIGSVASFRLLGLIGKRFCDSNSPIRNISMRFWSMARNTYIRWSRCVGKRMG